MNITPEQAQKFKFRKRLEEEQAAAQPQQAAAQPEYDKGGEPFYQDFGEGLGVSALKTNTGLKDLLGPISPWGSGASPEDRATLADWKADAGQSGWGKGGEVVGDVAQIVGTGGVGGGVVKGGLTLAAKAAAKNAPKVLTKGLLKARNMSSPILKDVLATGAVGATQIPEEGETRLGKGFSDAEDALIGGVAFKGLGKLAKGIAKTEAGQKLLNAGVPLTPAMAAKGTGAQSAENLLRSIPIMSKGRDVARDSADVAWAKMMMQEAAPAGVKLSGTNRDRAYLLKKAYTDGYSKAWGKAEKPTVAQIMGMQNTLKKTGTFIGEDGKGALRKVSKDVKNLSGDFNASAVQNLDHTLKKQIRRAARAGDVNLEEGLNAVRLKLRDTLPASTRSELKALDNQYGKYLVVKKAGSKASENMGNFNPAQFSNSVKTVGGETRTFVGGAPLQELSDAANATLGKAEPNILMDMRKGVIRNFPTHQPTVDAMGRAVLGETAAQKALTKAIESPVAEALRKLGVRGTLLNVADEKLEE